MTKPYPYQKEDVKKLEAIGGRGLLAWEMGLGKSLAALYYAKRNPNVRPIVIVCPASLKYVWEREASHHFGMRAEILEGTRPPKGGLIDKPAISIVNYDILITRRGDSSGSGWLRFLKRLKPQLIIIDECQYIGNQRSKRTKAVRHLCEDVPHVIALSGTPLTSRPAELWPTLNILRPNLWPKFQSYAERYCSPRWTPWGWDYRGSCNLGHLHRTLKETVMLRRRKSEVLTQLPDKVRSVVPVDLDNEREYRSAETDFRSWLGGRSITALSGAMRAEGVAKLGYLKRLAGVLKLPSVFDWVDRFLAETDQKLVLFAVHKKVVRELRTRYERTCVVVDGSVTGKKRHLAVDRFQNRSDCRLFIGNIIAAGVGLTLTAASTVAFAELDWTPGNHVQAEDRCHRIGQKRGVDIYYLIGRDTIESRLLRLIQRKQKVLASTLDGKSGEDLNVHDQLIQEMRSRK